MRRRLWRAGLTCVLIAAIDQAPARAAEPLQIPIHLAIAAGLILQGVDAGQTLYLAGAGQAHELNPIFAPWLTHPTAAGAFKMSVATGSTDALRVWHPARPRLALVVALVQDGFYVWVVTHNAHAVGAARHP